jgi:hypothetical protein
MGRAFLLPFLVEHKTPLFCANYFWEFYAKANDEGRTRNEKAIADPSLPHPNDEDLSSGTPIRLKKTAPIRMTRQFFVEELNVGELAA